MFVPRHLAWISLLVLFSWPVPAALQAAPDDDYEQPEIGKSAVPIVGYDDKDGWLFGGAGFLYSDKKPGIIAGFFFVSNLNDFNSATLNYEQRSTGPGYYGVHLLGEKAYDYYFGEGDLTPVANPLFLRQNHYEVKPAVRYLLREHLSAGVFTDFRMRREVDSQVIPNEATNAYGLHLDWDTRDKLLNTRRGRFLQLEMEGKPGEDGFGQATVDLRDFGRINRFFTLASRLSAGATLGTPTYLFQYRVGGVDLLRGYQDNRFRGDDYAVGTEELRWVLKKWLSFNTSVDAGDIGDGVFHQLKASYQAGFRVGIPPDWTEKLRFDFGIGADQTTFQFQFGEVF